MFLNQVLSVFSLNLTKQRNNKRAQGQLQKMLITW